LKEVGQKRSVVNCRHHVNNQNTNLTAMKYKVHRLDVNSHNMQEKLQEFLNSLRGEVITVLPNVQPSFQFMGATSKVNFLLIVEKV